MKAIVYNGSIAQEILGANICELVFEDGRRLQISTSPNESGLILMRVWRAGGIEVHGNGTDLSMTFNMSPANGVEIRSLDTNNRCP